MASARHSDEDGSNIFWPGYVDAVTNLVLNLLFLLTIMIVAVFMFALELGRATQGGGSAANIKTSGKTAEKSSVTKSLDLSKENIELKKEIERLNRLLAAKAPSYKTVSNQTSTTLDATAKITQPPNSINKAIAKTENDITIRFVDDAVDLTTPEQQKLKELLKPIVAKGGAYISIDVPAGFTEAKRMAFYRGMAVRNIIMEMNLPKDKIDIKVREVQKNGNSSIVKVRAK